MSQGLITSFNIAITSIYMALTGHFLGYVTAPLVVEETLRLRTAQVKVAATHRDNATLEVKASLY